MNKTVPIIAAAAAVVVIGIIGFNALWGDGRGQGEEDVEPTATAELTATTEPSGGASVAPPPDGQLEPGTYLISDVIAPALTPVSYTFDVPAGWAARSEDLQISKNDDTSGAVQFTPFLVTHVYTDACDSEGNLTEIGPTVDDLVTALVDQANSDATEPVDIEVDGNPAKLITMSVPSDLDTATCRHPDLLIQIWADAGENSYLAIPVDPPDLPNDVYIVDVNGERVVFVTGGGLEASEADVAELEGLIESIRFQP